jgi:peroxisomal membrane protein 4
MPEQPYHSFLAGAFGGYFVWGRYSGVNYQLLLYLASRIVVASMKLASEKGIRPFSSQRFRFPRVYPWAAAGIWGTVMMLFEEFPDMLHPSLKRSMDEIYRFRLSSSSIDR